MPAPSFFERLLSLFQPAPTSPRRSTAVRRNSRHAAIQRAFLRPLHVESLEDRSLLAVINPVSNTDTHPNRAAVQLQIAWDTNGNGNFDRNDSYSYCSGAMVSSHQVLTAAHCLYDHGKGGYADWVFAHPGRDSRYDRPYGEAEGIEWFVPNSYQRGNDGAAWDLGIVALDRNIGDYTGWFGYDWISRLDPFFLHDPYTFEVIHYPADHGYDGVQQYSGGVKMFAKPFDRFSTWSVDMGILWTAQGSSGSPLFTSTGPYDNTIVGVLSQGDDIPAGNKGIDYYVKLDFPKVAWISEQLERNGRPTDRPVLVDYDRWFDQNDSTISNVTPTPGDTLTAQAKIFNAGTADATNVRVRFRLSTDADYDSSDELLGDATISRLDALRTGVATLNFTMPTATAGRHFIVWTTDPNDTITEFDAPFQDVRVACRMVAGSCSVELGHRRHGSQRIDLRDDSYEVNDSRTAAASVPVATWLRNLSGTATQYDDDWYQISVPAGKLQVRAELTFEHDHGDIDLELYDNSGRRVASSRGTEDRELIDTIVTSSGTYFLRVFFGNAGNRYDLRWDAFAAPDLMAESFSIASGTTLAGASVTANFRIRNTGGAASEFDVAFYISQDATVDASDRRIGSHAIGSLAAGATTANLSKTVTLPQPGDKFWQGDDTYYIGMVIDPDNDVREANESNNSGRGDSLDRDTIDVTIHRPGTLQVISDPVLNRIQVPRFDTSLGVLEKVVVSVIATGFTDPGGTTNCPQCLSPVHVVDFDMGPFSLIGPAIPTVPFLFPGHTHLLQLGTAHEFTGAELAAFRNGPQSWTLPSNARTSTEASHAHDIDELTFVTTTNFIFDPPDPDLRTTAFTISRSELMAGDEFQIEYTIENAGPGVALPSTARVVISRDQNITVDDPSLRTIAIEELLSPGESIQRSDTISLRRPGDESWQGDGDYYIGIILDYDREIDETNESNNAGRGNGLDFAPVSVTVHAPGTLAHTRVYTNEIVLPSFDSTLGTLQKAIVAVSFVGGVTDSGGPSTCGSCPPLLHSHLVNLEIGSFEMSALAVTLPSPAPHPLHPLSGTDVRIYEAAELQPFLAGTRRFTLPQTTTDSQQGHTHRIQQAVFVVDTMFHYTRLPDLRGRVVTSSTSEWRPGSTIDIDFAVENSGLLDAGTFDTSLVLRSYATGATLVLGQVRIDPLDAQTASDLRRITVPLPPVDDPFWIGGSGEYFIDLRVDPNNEIPESDEANNEGIAVGIDSLAGSVTIPEPPPPDTLPLHDFVRLTDLNPATGDLWFRYEVQRNGPLVIEADTESAGELRLSLYESQPAGAAFSQAGLNQTPQAREISTRGRARIERDSQAGEWLVVRLSGEATLSRLTIANVVESDGGTVTFYGTDAADQFTVLAGATLLLNDVGFDLDGLGNKIILNGGPGADTFRIVPSPAVEIRVQGDQSAGDQFEFDAGGSLVTREGSELLTPNRQPVAFNSIPRARIVNAGNWNNLLRREDANNDFAVSPIDALVIINTLNQEGSRQLPVSEGLREGAYYDVNGDGFATPADVLVVVNYLNALTL